MCGVGYIYARDVRIGLNFVRRRRGRKSARNERTRWPDLWLHFYFVVENRRFPFRLIEFIWSNIVDSRRFPTGAKANFDAIETGDRFMGM